MKKATGRYPLISIIIPSCNAGEYMERSVDSVIKQTYEHLEIILVDDSSLDSSGAICDVLQIRDQRIRVIQEKGGGVARAKNAGIESSHGEYLMFVEGGDWLDEDAVEILFELCMDYDADIAECQYREIISETRAKRQCNTGTVTLFDHKSVLENMLDEDRFQSMAWGKLYKRETIGEIRFPINKLNEDEFTVYKYVCNARNFVHIDLIKYNKNCMLSPGNAEKQDFKNIHAYEAIAERKEFLKNQGIQLPEEERDSEAGAAASWLQTLPDNVCERTYDEILLENQALQLQINALLNSRTWRYAEKVKNILGIKKIVPILKRAKRKLLNQEMPQALPETYPVHNPANTAETVSEKPGTEFDYNHLLSKAEYKFFQYKDTRDRQYPLDIAKIECPFKRGLVSVVLPVYNGEDYIEASIKSVLNQTYKSFELIIIDDGSTDNTANIVDHYAAQDSRIQVVHQQNIRLPRTLSKGFRMAQGEFYTWTSADNIMHEEFLERFVKELQDNPSLGMTWGNMRLIDEYGNPIVDNQWYPNAEYPEEVLFPSSVLELNVVANNYIGAAFMYRAICAHIVLDYSSYKFCTEDYDYWMKINEICSLRHTSFTEPLYSYRFHPNSLTSKDKEFKITENRYKLMLLDDFRRDYYLKPLIWIFNGDAESHPWYQPMKTLIEQAGHFIVDYKYASCLENNLYERIIAVNFEKEYEECGLDRIPDSYNVLVSKDSKVLKENWDCCIVAESVGTAGRLDGYQGWYKIADCRTCFSFLDTKAKTKFLYTLEAEMDSQKQEAATISVILHDTGNQEMLDRCLQSIANQEGCSEVVLIKQSTKKMGFSQELQKSDESGLNIKVIQCVSSNVVTQINMGIWQSTGDILVFGEDDYLFDDHYFINLKKMMSQNQVKAVCGSVKCRNNNFEQNRILLGEHRFYTDGLADTLERNYALNISVKRDEVLMAGGLYHLSPELNDKCIEASLFGLLQIICQNRSKSIFKSRACSVYRQRLELPVETNTWMCSRLLGFYRLGTQLLLPCDTYPEAVKANPAKLDEAILEFMLQNIRDDFTQRSQADWIRRYYSGIKMPFISVIIPIYNTEKELERCIESCIHQSLRNIEIILVDDGSWDNSGKLCDQYAQKDNRIKVLHKNNGGLSDARNAGLDLADAPYIMFVDSDDWIDLDMCETLYTLALEKQADIVECSYRNVYPDRIEEETDNSGEIIEGDAIFALKEQLQWKHFKSVAWNKLYHQKIFADGKRYPKNKYHEDEFFTHLAFYAAKKLVSVDFSKYNYWHGRADSITGKVNENILDSCYALRSRVDFVMENKITQLEHDVKDVCCWTLFDRLYRCYQAKLSPDNEKLRRLLADLESDKDNVLSWDVAEEYKTNYKILLRSYELFGKCREDAELYEEMRKEVEKESL